MLLPGPIKFRSSGNRCLMKPPLGSAYVPVVKRNLEALGNIWIQLSLDPKHVVHSFRRPKTSFWSVFGNPENLNTPVCFKIQFLNSACMSKPNWQLPGNSVYYALLLWAFAKHLPKLAILPKRTSQCIMILSGTAKLFRYLICSGMSLSQYILLR